MKRQKRVTRPSLERDTPLRNWETLFGSSGSPGNGKGASGVGVDAVQRGVEFAYRVSDEYLRQGQSFARAFTQPFAPAAGGSAANALPQLTERMMRYGSELSSMWMEAMRMMSNGASPAGSAFPTGGFPSPFATTPTPHPGAHDSVGSHPAGATSHDAIVAAAGRISIQVDSKLRARAAVELRGKPGSDITVGPLLLEGGKSRISNVKLERDDDDGLVVVVRVSARQPPGKYVAEILESSAGKKVGGASVGRVTVRLSR